MKSRAKSVGLGSTLFILMLVASFAVIRPMYIRVGNALSSLEKRLVEKAEDIIGLSFSYQSLSPSILSAISIKGIVVSDKSSGRKLVDVKKVTVSYNFMDFFSAHPTYAIRSVTINGVTFEYDLIKDKELTQKWIDLAKNRTKKDMDERKKFDLSILNINLPFVVQLKNVSLHYSDTWNDAVGTVKSLTLRNNFNATGIEVKGNGRASYRNVYITYNGRRSLMSVNFDLTGTLVPELDGSSASVRFSSAGGADFTVSQLDALVKYEDEKFEIRSMGLQQPFSLFMVASIPDKSFSLSGDFNRFEPFKLVRVRRAPGYFALFDGIQVSGKGNVFASKPTGVLYDAKFETEWTKRLLGHPFHGSIDVDGNKTRLTAHKLVATGDGVQADFAGEFVYKPKRLSGVLSCEKYALPNGNLLSGEVYIDPLDVGFMCFAPQVFLGEERSLTAVQATVIPENHSVDFTFECDDYSHAEFDESGHVRVDGSYLGGSDRYIQASGEVRNVFLDSAALIGAFFAKDKAAESLARMAKSLEPYIMNDELYFSSDFKDFSFNAPYCLVANTRKDRELLVFAVDGSNQTVQISQFDLQFGKLSTNASFSADFSNGFDNFTFFGEFTVNAMPYTFNGNYASRWLNIAGDYGFTAAVVFGDTINGSFGCNSFPLPLGKVVPSLTADANFSWRSPEDFSLEILNLEIQEVSGTLASKPRLAMTGTANQYGFMMNEIAYSDTVSSLNGSGNLLWNINNSIFDSIHLAVKATSLSSQELISLNADFTNPSQLPFSGDALKNDFYFDAQAEIHSFPVARFLRDQNEDNVVSLTAAASGTLSNPFVSLDVQNFGMSLYGSSLVARGAFVMDESGVSAENLHATWSTFKLNGGAISFKPELFAGEANIQLGGYLFNESFNMPLKVTVSAVPPVQKWHIPQNYTVSLHAGELSGNLFPKPVQFGVALMRTPGRFDIISEGTQGLMATLTDDGNCIAQLGAAAPIQMEVTGQVSKETIDLNFSEITSNLQDISSTIALPFLSFANGVLNGALRISGLIADPEFNGAVSVENLELAIPVVSSSRFRTKHFIAAINQSSISVPQTRFSSAKGGDLLVDMRAEFNRWRLGSLDLNLLTPEQNYIPVDMKLPLIRYKGGAGLDLAIALEENEMRLSGMIEASGADVEIVVSSLQDSLSSGDLFSLFSFGRNNEAEAPPPSTPSKLAIVADLDLLIGQRVQILFNPLLRGALVPQTPLSLYFDSVSGNFNLKGDVALRGGQIVWLNRNFYMREGRIVFNENQDLIDPRLTVRAETRERDSAGNQVTITLSTNNQPVSSLNPQFSASPAKSETEIMELLGQVISADSENATSLFLAGGDYLMQSAVIRNIENALRELGKFDIFSVRTNVLQNAVKQSMDKNSAGKQIVFSNFFDNSTVYIGKYFGSTVYVDALMHWTYDENKLENDSVTGGLVFQPEFGLEMTSPFVNIRWGVAPNIEAIQNNLWIPNTSITLSWKFSF